MIYILSQNKNYINICKGYIGIAYDKPEDVISLDDLGFQDDCLLLGHYTTHERVKEVVQEIWDEIKHNTIFGGTGAPYYEMPKE